MVLQAGTIFINVRISVLYTYNPSYIIPKQITDAQLIHLVTYALNGILTVYGEYLRSFPNTTSFLLRRSGMSSSHKATLWELVSLGVLQI